MSTTSFRMYFLALFYALIVSTSASVCFMCTDIKMDMDEYSTPGFMVNSCENEKKQMSVCNHGCMISEVRNLEHSLLATYRDCAPFNKSEPLETKMEVIDGVCTVKENFYNSLEIFTCYCSEPFCNMGEIEYEDKIPFYSGEKHSMTQFLVVNKETGDKETYFIEVSPHIQRINELFEFFNMVLYYIGFAIFTLIVIAQQCP